MRHDLSECGFQSPVELFYKLFIKLLRLVRRQAFILGLVVCEINFLGSTHKNFKNSCFFFFFSKVSAGLAQISETSRFRDRDKTETLAIRDQDQGSETRDLQKMVLRPRPRPRPSLETTTLHPTHSKLYRPRILAKRWTYFGTS